MTAASTQRMALRLPPLLLGRRGQLLLGALFAVAMTIVSLVDVVAAERTVTDASGRTVTVGEAKRIVTIGGDVTEIVHALGAFDRVIARDQTSVYPEDVFEKPDVGYMRSLSAEGVLSVKPDLILAVDGSGPAETLDILKAASVPLVIVPKGESPEGVAAKITLVAQVLGLEEKGKALADKVLADFGAVEKALATLKPEERKKVVFLLSLQGGKPMAAGQKTAADAMIALAGGANPLTAIEGYRPASEEAIAAAAPDTILMMNRGGESHRATPEEVFATPAFALTPAARTKSLIVMDGAYLLNFGPRAALAAADLAHRLYPELALPEISAVE